MITFSKLGNHGRLGNQMFQYSLLKSISIKNNFIFAIPRQNHQLFDCFDIKCKVYDLDKNQNIIEKLKIYHEKDFSFSDDVFNCGDNVDYMGNFQSENYFRNIRDEILKDFKFKEEIENKSNQYLSGINNNKKIVSLHVRRGDYVNIQDLHPLCNVEYYKNAVKYFEDYDVLCFSDDIEWCKNNLYDIKNIKFCDNINDPYVELCIMSKCNGNIIANSSFSWWAAWLNKNEDKIIVTPQKWFGERNSHLNVKDLIPEGWIKI